MIRLVNSAKSVKSVRNFSGFTNAVLPDLPYDFGELEPFISAEIMKIHHSKHHAAYVTNLNASLAKLEEAKLKNDVSGIISLQQAIRFNGNFSSIAYHSLYNTIYLISKIINLYLSINLNLCLINRRRTHQPFYLLEEFSSKGQGRRRNLKR